MAEDGQIEDRAGIPTNLRLLIVLEQIASAGVPLTPTEVNKTLRLPKPTIHRLFATLEAEGFVQRDLDGRSYSPGRRLRDLAAGILSSVHIKTARVAILARLAGQIGETCNIALPDGDAMVYLDRIETHWPLRIQLPIGTRVPFYCTASGKMYLSTLSDQQLGSYIKSADLIVRAPNTQSDREKLIAEIQNVRKAGYSVDNEEFMEGMIAVGVPIFDANNRLVSTLSFHAPVQRMTLEDAVTHLDLLNDAARDLSAILTA